MNGSSRACCACRRDIRVEDLIDIRAHAPTPYARPPPKPRRHDAFVPSNGALGIIFKPNLGLPIQSLGSARTSRQRRGCPSGLVLSQRISPEIGQFDNELNQILDGDFHIGAEIHWDRFIKNLGALTPSAASSTYRNSREADRCPNTQCGLDPNPGPPRTSVSGPG